MIEILYIIYAGLAGLLGGSFLGVVVTRGPALWGLLDTDNESAPRLSWPPSTCPSCDRRLGIIDLIPLLGFALRRGKCANCKTAISTLYPFLEGMGLIIGVSCALLFPTAISAGLMGFGLLAVLGAAVIDARTGYLPDALTLLLATLGLLLSTLGGPISPTMAIWGWVFGWGSFSFLAAAYRELRGHEGLGGGDAKFLGGIGAFTGPIGVIIVMFLAAAGALIYLLIGQRRNDLSAKTEIRLGPWLAGGAAFTIILLGVAPAFFQI